jgi:hypothetical protein
MLEKNTPSPSYTEAGRGAITRMSVTFPDFSSAGEDLKANLIMPEPENRSDHGKDFAVAPFRRSLSPCKVQEHPADLPPASAPTARSGSIL